MKIIAKIFDVIGFAIKAIFKMPSFILNIIARILKINDIVGKAKGWKSVIAATAITVSVFVADIEHFIVQACEWGFSWFCPGEEIYVVLTMLFGVLRMANEEVKVPDWLGGGSLK